MRKVWYHQIWIENYLGFVHLQKFKAHFQVYCLDKKWKCKSFVIHTTLRVKFAVEILNHIIKNLQKLLFFTLRVCDCKKPDCAPEMKPCNYSTQHDKSCGADGQCVPLDICRHIIEMGKGKGMEGNQDIMPWLYKYIYNGCCICREKRREL